MKKFTSIILVFLVIGPSPFISWAGNLEDAKQKVSWQPNDPNAHFNLGVAYFKNSKFKEAIASYKKAIQLNLNDAGVFNNLGAAYIEQGDYKQAIVSLKGAIKIDPSYASAHQNIAIAYEKLGLIEQAIASYKEVLKIDYSDSTARINVAKLEKALLEQKELTIKKSILSDLKALENRYQKKKENLPKDIAKTSPGDRDRQFLSFCKSGLVVPIDCNEADKNSREIWFDFTHIYSSYLGSGLSLACKGFLDGATKRSFTPQHLMAGELMRNGNVLISHSLINGLSDYSSLEFLGLEAKPTKSFIAVSGVKGLEFEEILKIELTQDVKSVIIKYADEDRVVHNCEIEYSTILSKKLKERQAYELAHAEAINSSRQFGRIAPSLLEQRSRETIPPSIVFSSIDPRKTFRTDSYITYIRGKVADNEGVLTLFVNGQKAGMKADGTFVAKLKLRIGENKIPVLAEDINGNITKKILTIIREDFIPREIFADIDIPPKRKANNPNGIAVVIGVESYQYVSDATYAYNDAEVFREYLADTMGFSKAKVKIITNRQASLAEFNKLLSPNGWLARNTKPGKSEIVIYFSGHGIPDQKTKQTGLLPFDVDPNYSIGFRLSELYASLGNLNAKSVSVFLDACFTGENRERRMLLADARGIVVVPSEKSLPNNITVLSAASGGQFSGALKEKEHGLFTYYVLKGLGGDADDNQDKKLTIGELGEYVQVKVKEQAAIEGREQVPELQGDTEKVLVHW